MTLDPIRRAERLLDRAVTAQPPCWCGLHACCDHKDYPGTPMYQLPEWIELTRLRSEARA